VQRWVVGGRVSRVSVAAGSGEGLRLDGGKIGCAEVGRNLEQTHHRLYNWHCQVTGFNTWRHIQQTRYGIVAGDLFLSGNTGIRNKGAPSVEPARTSALNFAFALAVSLAGENVQRSPLSSFRRWAQQFLAANMLTRCTHACTLINFVTAAVVRFTVKYTRIRVQITHISMLPTRPYPRSTTHAECCVCQH